MILKNKLHLQKKKKNYIALPKGERCYNLKDVVLKVHMI